MIDLLLGVALLVVLPGYSMASSLRTKLKPSLPQPRVRRYVSAMLTALALTGVLAFRWSETGRPWSALGLQAPVSLGGRIGLALAVCILTGAGFAIIVRSGKGRLTDRSKTDDEIMPRTRGELCLFLVMILILGVAWEVLYRGFLLWLLPIYIGLPAAVVVAATAYGLAHRVKSVRLLAASLLSAFVFTLAYAATRSLWWLMLVHCGLPVLSIAALAKPVRKTPSEAGEAFPLRREAT